MSGYEKLAYFLNDEKGSGIYISNGYKNFIKWQNEFLEPIVNSYKNKKNSILSCYISRIEKTISVQSSNDIEILQIEKCFENSYYKNFNDLIYTYANRDINNYNKFNYDFKKIEEELGNLILPGKCLFDENINYVIYQLEGFKLINYDFFINYGKKYGEQELTIEEKKIILQFSNKEYMNYIFIYDSFIFLVNYLNNNYISGKNKKIIEIIENIDKFKTKIISIFLTNLLIFLKKKEKKLLLENY